MDPTMEIRGKYKANHFSVPRRSSTKRKTQCGFERQGLRAFSIAFMMITRGGRLGGEENNKVLRQQFCSRVDNTFSSTKILQPV